MNSVTLLEMGLSLLLIIAGFLVAVSKDAVKAVIALSVLSMMTALAFVLLKAPDVAITEVVIGSGLITFLFLFTLKDASKAGDQ